MTTTKATIEYREWKRRMLETNRSERLERQLLNAMQSASDNLRKVRIMIDRKASILSDGQIAGLKIRSDWTCDQATYLANAVYGENKKRLEREMASAARIMEVNEAKEEN